MTYVLGFDTSAPGMSVDAAESGHHIYASRLYTQAGGGVNAITFWVENANGAVGNAGIYDDAQGDLAARQPLAQGNRQPLQSGAPNTFLIQEQRLAADTYYWLVISISGGTPYRSAAIPDPNTGGRGWPCTFWTDNAYLPSQQMPDGSAIRKPGSNRPPAAYAVCASYQTPRVNLTTKVEGGGRIDPYVPDGELVEVAQAISVEATAGGPWAFDRWKMSGLPGDAQVHAYQDRNFIDFEMPNNAVTITAVFKRRSLVSWLGALLKKVFR